MVRTIKTLGQMKLRKVLLFVMGLVFIGVSSCDGYEDYVTDYEYSIVYFGTQKPLRTVVSYDEMTFKVGVALGGKQQNNTDEYVNFKIDSTLLDNTVLAGAENFTLLPGSYYTLSDYEEMVIPKGRLIGDVTVTLDREKFISDALSTSETYALPLRITSSTLDSISSGSYDDEGNQIIGPKDYTILVVKYISAYHGVYYHTGTQVEAPGTSEQIETVYDDADISKNETWSLSTVDANSVTTSGIGDFTDGSLILDFAADHSVVLSTTTEGITNFSGSGIYDPENRSIALDYAFSRDGKPYEITEVLHLRRPPEEDLTFEEW